MAVILPYDATPLEQLAQHVQAVLHRSGVLGIPTETFYGLGVNPFDPTALSRLCTVKRRFEGTPILVLVSSPHDLSLFAEHVPTAASILIEVFWPGPLTILFPARATLPAAVTGGTGRVGIRLSSCQPLRALLERVGPLTGTSANRTGAVPAHTPGEMQDTLGQEVDLIVDAGPTPGGSPSTVVEVDAALRVVREGAIARDTIEAALRPRGFSLKKS